MISLISILLFFLYLWGLGYTATYWVKKPEHPWERQLLNLAIGLGIFPILSILINFLHIPLDWKLFLVLSLVFPLYNLVNKIRTKQLHLPTFKFTITKSDLALLAVLIIVAFSLFMYTTGAFAYPYLEDEDPWGHSVGVKYVAIEKNAYDPVIPGLEDKIDPVLSYIDPYPPAYDILLGILHQTSPDLNWTIKFFNALLISLGFLFFYLFAKDFMGNQNKALLATFILASLPAYLSHFIWAHALAITLFFPAMYAFWKIKEDHRWTYIAAIIVASIWVAQNIEEPIKLTMLFLVFVIVASITSGKFLKKEFIAIMAGFALSLLWWGVMIKKYSLRGFVQYFTGGRIFPTATTASEVLSSGASSAVSASTTWLDKLFAIHRSLTSPGGSGARAYGLNDFVIAQNENMINNPIGLGVVVSVLILLGIIYILWHYKSSLVEEKNTWLCLTLFWLIITFWGVNGVTFPTSIMRGPFRTWMLLAIPVALLAAETTFVAMSFGKQWKIPKIVILLLVLVGIVLTSTSQRYAVNTAIWPTSGSFTNQQDPFEYGAWFSSLPPNTNVFLYTPRDKLVIGYGAFSCLWCPEVIHFRKDILSKDAKELYLFLKDQGYGYFIINGAMDRKTMSTSGENKIDELLPQRYNEIFNSGLFTPILQRENRFVVLKVN